MFVFLLVEALANGMAACAPSNTSGETVTDLVRAVREEDVKVHINVEDGVRVSFRVLALRGMCNFCFIHRNRTLLNGRRFSSQTLKQRTSWRARTLRHSVVAPGFVLHRIRSLCVCAGQKEGDRRIFPVLDGRPVRPALGAVAHAKR